MVPVSGPDCGLTVPKTEALSPPASGEHSVSLGKWRRAWGVVASLFACFVAGGGCVVESKPVANSVTARIQSVRYSTPGNVAAFGICHLPPGDAREKLCAIGYSKIQEPNDSGKLPVIKPQLLTTTRGYTYTAPEIAPNGDAIYFTRELWSDWRKAYYNAPSQVIRRSLVDHSETVISEHPSGLHGVAGVVATGAGDEHVFLYTTRSLQGIKSAAPSMAVVTFGADKRVSSKQEIDVRFSGSFVTLPELGVLAGVDLPGVSSSSLADTAVAFLSVSNHSSVAVFDSFADALDHAKATASAPQHKIVAERLDALNSIIEETPTHKIGLSERQYATRLDDIGVTFEGRVSPFIAQKGSAFGNYLFHADWRNHAIAVMYGAFPQNEIPVVFFSGDTVPFRQRGLGVVDCSEYLNLREWLGE